MILLIKNMFSYDILVVERHFAQVPIITNKKGAPTGLYIPCDGFKVDEVAFLPLSHITQYAMP